MFGLAFHIGARVAAKARADEVPVSSALEDLMSRSGIRFKDHGVHRLKCVPERWRLHRSYIKGTSETPQQSAHG
jgi:class 3 adenylate cyclase